MEKIMTEARKCSHALFWVFIIILFLLLAGSLVMNMGLFFSLLAGSSGMASTEAVDEFPKLTETWSYGKGTIKAVRITANGPLMRTANEGLFAKKDKIDEILSQIRTAGNDPQVRAIVLEVNSPGGAITPCDEIYHSLKEFKNSHPDRKIVVFMKSLAASGGYYIAMAVDHIVAEPTTLTGSIGVIMQTLNWKAFSEKIGVTDTTIKSGKNKDLLNPFKEVNEEQVALLQEGVDALHTRFVGIVQTNRNLNSKDMIELADGRIFTAEKALQKKLIDSIGYWDDVMNVTKKLCKTEEVKFVRYEKKKGFMDIFAEASQPIDLRSFFARRSPEILYLWQP